MDPEQGTNFSHSISILSTSYCIICRLDLVTETIHAYLTITILLIIDVCVVKNVVRYQVVSDVLLYKSCVVYFKCYCDMSVHECFDVHHCCCCVFCLEIFVLYSFRAVYSDNVQKT